MLATLLLLCCAHNFMALAGSFPGKPVSTIFPMGVEVTAIPYFDDYYKVVVYAELNITLGGSLMDAYTFSTTDPRLKARTDADGTIIDFDLVFVGEEAAGVNPGGIYGTLNIHSWLVNSTYTGLIFLFLQPGCILIDGDADAHLGPFFVKANGYAESRTQDTQYVGVAVFLNRLVLVDYMTFDPFDKLINIDVVVDKQKLKGTLEAKNGWEVHSDLAWCDSFGQCNEFHGVLFTVPNTTVCSVSVF